MIVKPKGYQSRAVENALEIFRCALAQIAAAPDSHSRRAASAFNGCVLVQAPTGSGKTLIAGLVAEVFSRDAPICWLWLTPFKGLVEQARIAIKNQFTGLRVRDIDGDRVAHSTKSGDVFVTTWAAVAASRKESRRLRQDGDHAVSLDHLVAQLRQRGFKLGVVVDEAHHTFSLGTEAMRFYRETLQPEFTLLITATPDDKDAEAFRKASGIAVMHRITVSRLAAVDAHLIKPGIKSVAYLADATHKPMVDFGRVALTDGVRVHQAIKAQLQAAGIDLTPLLLVQVGSSTGSVEQAKQNLMALGLKEDAIAVYTADEPNDDLLAVARDEAREALIFKMAVALGFDAPRAFALVALRGARDADFGVQIVGRILRVDWRLQNKPLPELLRYGYVFLADAETQTGLVSAADRINAIKTELSTVSPFTMLVKVAGATTVQVVKDGQAALLPQPWTLPDLPATPGAVGDSTATETPSSPAVQPDLLEGFILGQPPPGQSESDTPGKPPTATPPPPGSKAYALREGVQRVFKTEQLKLDTSGLLACVGQRARIDDAILTAGLRQAVLIQRVEEEIFTRDVHYENVQARLSDAEVAKRAQQVLFEPDYLDPRELQTVFLSRLERECRDRGMLDIAEVPDRLRRAMHLILAWHPRLLREAVRLCCAENAELADTAALPAAVNWPDGLKTARLGAYGVFPPDLNNDEHAFAQLLDGDTSSVVEWWHRNEDRKPWLVGLVMPDGAHYYPDFIVKVRGRDKGGGLLLLEVKGPHLINSPKTPDKVQSAHQLYRKPVMVTREESGRWMTLRFDDQTGKNEPDAVFRIDALPHY